MNKDHYKGILPRKSRENFGSASAAAWNEDFTQSFHRRPEIQTWKTSHPLHLYLCVASPEEVPSSRKKSKSIWPGNSARRFIAVDASAAR
jgi:hypothetical protein